ncbi:acyl carrier protein [Pseudochrobactrum sp. MP213Fo]|uniref:acyl carrier protein n=1 Tax=Pseudochrobactrum sp. MP213Fo TaxID=3022250 RepID=UPI003BA3AD5E
MNKIADAKKLLSGCLFIPEEHIDENAELSSLAEIDSLTFELIVMELEKRLGHEVDPIALLEMRSVKDIATLLAVKA